MAASDLAVRPCHDLFNRQAPAYAYEASLSDFKPPLYDSPLLEQLKEADRNRFRNIPESRWSGSRFDNRKQRVEESPMSQWSPKQDKTSNVSNNDSDTSRHAAGGPSGARVESPTSYYSPLPPAAATSRLATPAGRSFELPPLPRANTVTGGSFPMSVSRSTTLPSIFSTRPQEPNDDPSRKRKLPLSEMNMPAPSLPQISSDENSQRLAPVFAGLSPSPQPVGPADHHMQRRKLPARSPLQRSSTLSHLLPPQATINAQQNPFPTSPLSTASNLEYACEGAALGTVRPSYTFSPAVAHSLSSVRRPSPSASTAGRAQSRSTSPSSAYSIYSHPGETSPRSRYQSTSGIYAKGTHSTGNESAGSTSATGDFGFTPGAQDRSRTVGIPISSSGGHNTYQMMTLETTSGTVQLPVDVQAASRVADEKRRRNAGASARFRERRKKKEVEATVTIRKFEQQVKDLTEDAEHYRRERDYMETALRQTKDSERHFPRPQSPRLRRPLPGHLGSNSVTDSYGGSQDDDFDDDAPQTVRRRTSSFPPPYRTFDAVHANPALADGSFTAHHTVYAPQQEQHHPQQIHPQQHHHNHHQHQQSHNLFGVDHFPVRPQPSTRMAYPGPPPTQLPPVNTLPPPPVMQNFPPTGPFNPFAVHRPEENHSAAPSSHHVSARTPR